MNDHKKRTAEMIAVMQAYVDGKAIEFRWGKHEFGWGPCGKPLWSWGDGEYRIATIPDSINWDHVAPEWKWMARDASGEVYFFKNEPRALPLSMVWSAIEDPSEARGFSSYARGTVDWKDSLVRRPE